MSTATFMRAETVRDLTQRMSEIADVLRNRRQELQRGNVQASLIALDLEDAVDLLDEIASFLNFDE